MLSSKVILSPGRPRSCAELNGRGETVRLVQSDLEGVFDLVRARVRRIAESGNALYPRYHEATQCLVQRVRELLLRGIGTDAWNPLVSTSSTGLRNKAGLPLCSAKALSALAINGRLKL